MKAFMIGGPKDGQSLDVSEDAFYRGVFVPELDPEVQSRIRVDGLGPYIDDGEQAGDIEWRTIHYRPQKLSLFGLRMAVLVDSRLHEDEAQRAYIRHFLNADTLSKVEPL